MGRPKFDQDTPAYTGLLGSSAEPTRHNWHILKKVNRYATTTDANYAGSLRVTSGYRCPVGNHGLVLCCGGSPTSNHQFGRAFDFNQRDSWENYRAFQAALDSGAGGDSYLKASNGTRYFWNGQYNGQSGPPWPLPNGIEYIQGHVSW